MKAGAGAFMKTPEDAEALAEACLELARGWGRQARVAVTDMEQPLGDAVGNALDVVEAVEVLRGEHRGRLRELAVAFAARGLSVTSGRDLDAAASDTERRARRRIGTRALPRDGRGARGATEGGRRPRRRAAPCAGRRADRSRPSGTLTRMATEEIGLASGALGAGRIRKGDRIDPAVGIVVRCKIGDGSRPDSRSGRCMRATTLPPRPLAGSWMRSSWRGAGRAAATCARVAR